MSVGDNPIDGVVALLNLQPQILAGLKEQKGVGDEAFSSRVSMLASAVGYGEGDLVAGFERVVLKERIDSKRAEFDSALRGQTLSASMIELFNRGVALANELSEEGRNVSFRMLIEPGESGVPVIRGNFRGARASSGGPGSGSRIDGWTAYQRGVKAGDSFVIQRTAKGEFRDETRNQDIPGRGLIKWIGEYYPDSKTAEILKAVNG